MEGNKTGGGKLRLPAGKWVHFSRTNCSHLHSNWTHRPPISMLSTWRLDSQEAWCLYPSLFFSKKKKCGCKFRSSFQIRSPLNDFHWLHKGWIQARGLKAICQESSAWNHTNHFKRSFSIFVSMFSPINRYGHYWPIVYNSAKESGASASQQWIDNRIAGLYVKYERNGKAMYW